ncbi:hypothetical protein B0H14DRAFT_613017 [Mycena olivaceomarginata]|nr:hypothetical protein B0H14DRAFT_613017 [Mycena olivaceomarginata]
MLVRNYRLTSIPRRKGRAKADMQVDEPRRLEEDAARALVELAEQKITAQSPRAPTERGKTGLAVADIPAERLPVEELSLSEAALAREAALRKQQEARREQVKIQKQHAHAAAALSILKERQDAAEKSKSAAQTTPPLSNADTYPAGNVVARNTVLPPTQAKLKTKKSKPVSGGVKLGPDVVAKVEPSVSADTSADVLASTNPSLSDPSPALERAAALGLRVRTNAAKAADTSTPSSKPKKTRNYSLPPISHLDPGSPQTDDIAAHRTGSDAGDIPIMPTAPSMPFDVSADVQLMNLRFALQDDGIIPWEAISRSRPLMPGVKKEVKKEVVEDDLQARILAPQSTPAPTPAQRPQPVINPPIATPPRSAPATPVVAAKLPKKQLPKFNKSKPQSGNTNSNIQASTSAAVDISVPLKPRPKDAPTVPVLPVQASPVTDPPKWSPPVPVAAPVAASVAAHSAPQRTDTNPISTKARALPQVRPESRSSNPGSGVSTPVHESNDYAGRPLNERVSATQWRGRSPARFRSPTPDRDRYGGRASNAYGGGEPQRYRSPEPVGRPRSPPLTWPVQSTPLDYHDKWVPRSPARSPSPQRFRPAPRRASPPPQKRVDPPARRNFSAPSAPAYYPRQDSPPKGPRQNIPRAPSQNQKRPRDDEYTTPFHPQKRFKDDGRDASAAASRSFELETDRPSLETRLARAPPDSWNAHQHPVRGESYHPVSPDYDDWAPRSEGLLSRLSEPGPGRGNPRGRGGPRGRANKSRGRGRGEVSLVERMY